MIPSPYTIMNTYDGGAVSEVRVLSLGLHRAMSDLHTLRQRGPRGLHLIDMVHTQAG